MASSACCSHRLSTRGFLRQSMDRVPLGTTNRLTRARVVSGKDSHSSRQHGFVKPIRALRLRRRSVSDDSASTTWVLPEEARARGMRVDTLLVLETNVDDLSPQIVAYAFEELLAAGALDVWSVPVTMKKGRMGTLLCALCDREHAERLCAIIFKETSSLGVRVQPCERVSVDRSIVSVATRWPGSKIHVKVGTLGSETVNVHPEYDDCAKTARVNDVALKTVFREAVAAYFLANPEDTYE